VKAGNINLVDLSLHKHRGVRGVHLFAAGEVLWDQFDDSSRLGGAPLNFAAHAKRLGHDPLLVSAVGVDAAGAAAMQAITALGLDTTFIQSTDRFNTGVATVRVDTGEDTSFTIQRPAAYDAIALTDAALDAFVRWNPSWFYYGTVFAARPEGRGVLDRLLRALPHATRFYDLNLRPGHDEPDLVDDLLHRANVVKLNERELRVVHDALGLPCEPETFCEHGADRYGWKAVCVTFGARGCAMRVGDEYVESPGCRITVADPVGAGDAFAAAFVHGLASNWRAARIARFANRVGALVASAHGAIPDFTLDAVFDA
jgi:fructokinase